jgi:hypothetical protein
MVEANKYDFSFTGFSLRINDMRRVAEAEKNGIPYSKVDFGDGNPRSGKRRLSEINKRLRIFTAEQSDFFLLGDLTTQKQLAFLSVCKTHAFIRDFVVDVLREKVLVFDYEITEGEYITFFRRKSDVHPEMDDLTDITQNKVRQVTFKILEQAGMIDNIKTKNIQPQLLDSQLIKAIISDDSQWLKVFLMSDLDIENYKN